MSATKPIEGQTSIPVEDEAPPTPKRSIGRPKGSTKKPPKEPKAPKAPKTDKAPPTPPRTGADGKFKGANDLLREQISNTYTVVGVMLATPITPAPLQAIGIQAVNESDKIAEAWVELAKTNPAVRRAWQSITSTSAVGLVISAHASLVIAAINARQAQPPKEPAAPKAEQPRAQSSATQSRAAGSPPPPPPPPPPPASSETRGDIIGLPVVSTDDDGGAVPFNAAFGG